MNGQLHSVRKFVLELQVPSGDGAYQLQRRCSDMIRQELVTGLDSLLNDCFDEKEVTRIPYLEIDLGDITPGEIENVFVSRCLQQLSEKLKTISGQRKTGQDIPVERISTAQDVIDRFIYFLETGQLPDLARLPAMSEWSEAIIEAVAADNAYFAKRFRAALAKHTKITERLMRQFDGAFIERLIGNCEPSCKKEVIMAMLRDTVLAEIPTMQGGDKLVIFLFAAAEPLIRDEIERLLFLLQQSQVQYPSLPLRKKIMEHLVRLLQQAPAGKMVVVIGEIKKWLARQMTGLPALQTSLVILNELEVLLRQQEAGIPAGQAQPIAADVDTAKGEQSPRVTENKEAISEVSQSTAVFVDNAGLIILHPFLTSFFEKAGLTRQNRFIDDEAKYRVVHLLQYMAGGQEEAPEYLMPLNKILCGVPREMHIDRFIRLTEKEKEEAGKMLQAVIGHWTVLGNSSVAALQETFLQRRGKLDFLEEDRTWKLQVERKAFDILLDRLPWGYSQVQLSWMEHRLVTEW